MPRTSSTLTISLPPAMLAEVERVRREEHRTRSELFREALRTYLRARAVAVTPTPAELRSIRRGRAAFARGDVVTLDAIRHELATPPRRSSKKSA